jgi:hypothetical protein
MKKNTTNAHPVPEGWFGVPYDYYDPDDLTRRRDVADYVAPPVTREYLEQRRRERTNDQ